MNDSRCAFGALALLGGLTTAGSALAADPPAPAPAPTTVTAPAPTNPAPAAAPAAAPAPDAATPAPAASDEKASPDSEEDAAVPAPSTSPSAIFKAREIGARPAAPPPVPDINSIDDGLMGSHQEHWLLGLGFRQTFVTNEGYDLFGETNALPQFSLYAGRTLYASGPLSFAALLAWDWGSTEADARGADTELVMNRVTLGGEGRFHILRRLYAFGRIAPGVLNAATTFRDRIVNADRETSSWAFAADFSLGAALEFAGDARGKSSRPRGFISADGGYGWAQSTKLDYEPEEQTSPVRLQPLSLGELALRGGFFRVSAIMTY
jgi:hypothetical protein